MSLGEGKAMSKILIFIGVLLVAVTFQNCSSPKSDSGSAPQKLQANGDGYGGKATYQELALDGSCGKDMVRSEIEIADDGKATMTRENCDEIPAKSVTVSSLMPHNPEHFTYNTRTFQKDIDANAVTKLFCRGEGINLAKTRKNVVDAMIQISLNDESVRNARVIVGQYTLDGTRLIRVLRVASTSVSEHATPTPDGKAYVFTNIGSTNGTTFQLSIHTPTPTSQGYWNGVLVTNPNPNNPNGEQIIQQVKCS